MDKKQGRMGGALLLAAVALLFCAGTAVAIDSATAGSANQGIAIENPDQNATVISDNIDVTAVNNMSFSNYTTVNTTSGQIQAWSDATVVLLNASGWQALPEMQNRTWYGSDTDNLTTEGFTLDAVVDDPATGLDNMGVALKFPNGNVTYAGNFSLTQAGDGWQLNADHAGFRYVDLEDVTGMNNTSYVWDNRPLAVPGNISDKPFYITLWTDKNLS